MGPVPKNILEGKTSEEGTLTSNKKLQERHKN
jgi:hypothetical protein